MNETLSSSNSANTSPRRKGLQDLRPDAKNKLLAMIHKHQKELSHSENDTSHHLHHNKNNNNNSKGSGSGNENEMMEESGFSSVFVGNNITSSVPRREPSWPRFRSEERSAAAVRDTTADSPPPSKVTATENNTNNNNNNSSSRYSLDPADYCRGTGRAPEPGKRNSNGGSASPNGNRSGTQPPSPPSSSLQALAAARRSPSLKSPAASAVAARPSPSLSPSDEATVAREVKAQVDFFKAEYRQLMEEDYRRRFQALEAKLEEREEHWRGLLRAERERTTAREAAEQGERFSGFDEERRELSAVRFQMLEELKARESSLMQRVAERHRELQSEHEQLVRQAQRQVAEAQQACAASLLGLQQELSAAHVALAAAEAEREALRQAESARVAEALAQRLDSTRAEVRAAWEAKLQEQQQAFLGQVELVAAEYRRATDELREGQARRELELQAQYEAAQARLREGLEAKWSDELRAAQDTVRSQRGVMASLRESSEALALKLTSTTEQLELARAAAEAEAVRLTQQQQRKWQDKMDAMRRRYEGLLEAALDSGSGGDGDRLVPLAELQRAESRVAELEATLLRQKTDAAKALEEAQHTHAAREQRLRLELQAQHDELLAQTREHGETLRADLLREAQALEAERRAAAEAERAALTAAHEEALRGERQAAARLVEEAHRATREQLLAAAKKEEEVWQRRLEAYEQLLRDKESALVRREAELRDRVAREEAALHSQAAEQLQQQRSAFAATMEAERAALREEREAWERGREAARLEMQREGERRFQEAKRAFVDAAVGDAMRAMLELQRDREQMWCQQRQEELAALARQHGRERELWLRRQERVNQQVSAAAESLVAAAEQQLDQREAQLAAALAEMHAAHMAQAEERAAGLVERQAQECERQQEAVLARVAAEWAEAEERRQRAAVDAAASREAFECDTRAQYESLLAEQQRRWQASAEAQRTAREAAFEEKQRALRQAQEERIDAMVAEHLADAERREAHFSEVVRHYDVRLAALRERTDAQLHEREEQSACDKARYEGLLAELRRTHEREAEARAETARAAAEARARALEGQLAELRARALSDAAAAEERYLAQVRQAEERARQDYTAQLAELHASLAQRLEEGAGAGRAVEAQAQEALQQRAAELEELYARRAEEALATAAEQESRHQSELRSLRAAQEGQAQAAQEALERALREQAEDHARELAEARAEQQRRSGEALESLRGLLRAAQEEREALRVALDDAVWERQQLALQSDRRAARLQEELWAKYEGLVRHAREAAVAEQEAWVQQALESEERRFARELVQRRRDPHRPGGAGGPTDSNSGELSRSGGGNGSALVAAPPLPAADRKALLLHRLEQLWEVSETPEDERQLLREHVDSLDGPAAQVRALEKAVQKMEVQLPLLELVTQREMLLVETEAPDALSANASRHLHRTPDGKGSRDDDGKRIEESVTASQRKRQVREELEGITQQLRSEVQRFERQYGQKLCYKGERVMDGLQQQQQQQQGGAVGGSAR